MLKHSRRQFFANILALFISMLMRRNVFSAVSPTKQKADEIHCLLYRAINGRPTENLLKVIELMGGIEKLFGPDDIIIIKPNIQWWNQGAPNIAALKAFVDQIMNHPGEFTGEVIIAENCHRGTTPWRATGTGWARSFSINSDLKNIENYNQLSEHLKKKYGNQFTACHWIDVNAGGKRVFGPKDGTGYVYCDGTGSVPLISLDNGCKGDKFREVIMTYPIFKTDRGTIVDFKNGIWERGEYTQQPLKFINFAALNHHSTYCGATSAVKNYLGVSDLSGGPDPHSGGMLSEKYYNFHSFPLDKWAPGPKPGMLGSEIGVFMNTIRKADLNITTSEWVGLSSRTDMPAAQTKAVLACTDPVALDYHACKYLLFPNSGISVHNPDKKNGPLHQYLLNCAEKTGYCIDEKFVGVKSYDFNKLTLQNDYDLAVKGDIKWRGTSFKNIIKYLVLRFL